MSKIVLFLFLLVPLSTECGKPRAARVLIISARQRPMRKISRQEVLTIIDGCRPSLMVYDFYQVFDLKKNGEVEVKLSGNYLSVDNLLGVVGSWDFGGLCCDPDREFSPSSKGYVRAVRP